MQKINLLHLFISKIQSVLDSHDQNSQNQFLSMPTKKIFDQLLVFVNLYQHAKYQFIPSVHYSNIVNFRVLPRDWPHTFLTMPTLKILILI